VSFLIKCITCLIVLAFVGTSAPLSGAQRSGRETPRPRVGDTVLLASPFQDRKLQVAVTAFADPFGGRASIRRGYRLVAAHLSATSRGSDSFEVDPSSFALLDDAGLYGFDMSWQLSRAELANHAPLRVKELEQGESTDGWLFFQVAVEARPSAIVYLGNGEPPYFQMLAWLDPVRSDEAGALPILEASGQPKGTLAIEYIITNFERTDPGIDPVRGSTTLALVVTITNTSAESWELPDDAFWIVDQYGLTYHREVYNREMASYQTFPDLGFRARPNERVQGVLMFELPTSSRFTHLLYVQGDTQLIVAGGPNPEVTMSAEDAERIVKIDTRTSLDPDCAGIEEWAEASRVSMETTAQVLETATEGDVTPDGLREAAGSLSLIKRDQEHVTVPEEAVQAQQDVVHLLTVTINALENAADQIESGAAAEDVMADLESPQSPIMVAAIKATRSVISVLGDDCPGNA
jgi:hypothetical protein